MLASEPFLDLTVLRPKEFMTLNGELGLAAIAFHPEFGQNGRRGSGKLYTFHAETPASRSNTPLLKGRAEKEHHHSVVTEWRVDSARPDRVDPASRREVLRIAQPGPGRNAGSLGFDPAAKPGEASYGLLYLGVGDGGSRPEVGNKEPQDPRSPLGKVLRVNPDPGRSAPGYRVPPTNPFVRPGAMHEVWALGLRRPGRFAWDRAAPGRMFLPDAGGVIQEINLGEAGRNYGWSLREGTFAVDPGDPRRVLPLPGDEASRELAFPVLQYDHDEGAGVVGGEVYRGRSVPALAGKYFFADTVRGRFFAAAVDALRQGRVGEFEEVGVLHNGLVGPFLQLLGGDDQADIHIGADEAGELYVVSDRDGVIRKVMSDPLGAAFR
ncbi:MAG: PQQ-dependent sugar dehydrogenase [Betaproteobacteria bacterium]|nr:PQQ-dependent sugar dehydrogenase [Betaproteobacteria bacterium]